MRLVPAGLATTAALACAVVVSAPCRSTFAELSALNEDVVESMTDAAAPRRYAPRISA